MGLPHVVVRFYTNPDGRAARRTTLVVLGLLGLFYISTFLDKSEKVFKGDASLGLVMSLLGWPNWTGRCPTSAPCAGGRRLSAADRPA